MMLGITDLILFLYVLALDIYHDFIQYSPDYIKGGYEPGNPIYPGCYELHNFVEEPAQVPIYNVPGHPVTGWKSQKEFTIWDEWGSIPLEDNVSRITPMYNFYKGMKAYDE